MNEFINLIFKQFIGLLAIVGLIDIVVVFAITRPKIVVVVLVRYCIVVGAVVAGKDVKMCCPQFPI